MTLSKGDLYEGVTSPISLALTQDEATLQGEVELEIAANEFSLAITRGRVTGNTVAIEAAGTTPVYPQQVTLVLEGHVSGDRISGTGTETIDAAMHHFEWETGRS